MDIGHVLDSSHSIKTVTQQYINDTSPLSLKDKLTGQRDVNMAAGTKSISYNRYDVYSKVWPQKFQLLDSECERLANRASTMPIKYRVENFEGFKKVCIVNVSGSRGIRPTRMVLNDFIDC